MGGSNGKQSYWRDTEFLKEHEEGSQLIDKILDGYRPLLKNDYNAYRNHCQRVYQFALYIMEKPTDVSSFQKLAISLAFHDLGIWTANTVDYIDPSRALAKSYLQNNSLTQWETEIDDMVEKHHQLLQGTLKDNSLPEVVRRADLVDFSWGWVKNGVPSSIIQKVQNSYKNEGFHARLVVLASAWFFRHPLNPAPMLRWSS